MFKYNGDHCSIFRIICHIFASFPFTSRLANQKNVRQCTNRIFFSYIRTYQCSSNLYPRQRMLQYFFFFLFRSLFPQISSFDQSEMSTIRRRAKKNIFLLFSPSLSLSLVFSHRCKKAKSIHIAYLIEDVCESATTCTCLAFVSVYSPGLHQQHQEKKQKKKRSLATTTTMLTR